MKSGRRLYLRLVLLVLLGACFWIVPKLLSALYFPNSAIEQSQEIASSQGYLMIGYIGEFVEQESVLGFTKVRVTFRDCSRTPPNKEVVIVMYRNNFLSNWNVESIKEVALE